MKLIKSIGGENLIIIFFIIVTVVCGTGLLVALKKNSAASKSYLTNLSGNNAVEFRKVVESGTVKSCTAYPTNNPLAYVVEVKIGNYGNYRLCVSSTYLTNGTPVAIKDLILYDNMSRRVPMAVRLSETNALLSSK